jgi:hypothetical protein
MAEERNCKNCIKNEVCKHFEQLEMLIVHLPHLASKEQLSILYQNVGSLCRLYQKEKIKLQKP